MGHDDSSPKIEIQGHSLGQGQRFLIIKKIVCDVTYEYILRRAVTID